MNQNASCDPMRVDLFLDQQLSDAEQTAFERHLEGCDGCRRHLESTAASDDVWAWVRQSLTSEQQLDNGAHREDSLFDGPTQGGGAVDHDAVLELLAPSDDGRMIGRLGTYEVMGIIGSGGMGAVLKAYDRALNRYVAIKVLALPFGSSGAARKRFAREAQAAAAVVHDNVVEIHGVAQTRGIPYLVMPYIPGASLQQRLDREGPFAPVEILRVGLQAARGLSAAHAQGLVHRDVKPANILLADGVERVKLTDFGLARAADDASLTRTGIIAGTPQYMSPEQARGESLDQRSDLFSLGCVLYAMCTGRPPFRAETSYGVLRRITDDEPRPVREINPDIPEWLCRIIDRLMAKQCDDRFQSAGEVAQMLEACLAHLQRPDCVPLPSSVERLQPIERAATAVRSKRPGGPFERVATVLRRPAGAVRWITAAALLVAMFFAGILIVLEWNKGKLVIESDADQVPVRITRGEAAVEELTVTAAGTSLRIAAGHYRVELLGEFERLDIENGTFTLNRGGEQVVRIRQVASAPPAEADRPSRQAPASAPPALSDTATRESEAAIERAGQRVETLRQRVATLEKQYAIGRIASDRVMRTRLELMEAQLVLAESVSERARILEGQVDLLVHLEKVITELYKAGRRKIEDVWLVEDERIEMEARLRRAREGGEDHTPRSATVGRVHYRGVCVRSEDGSPVEGAVVRFFLHRDGPRPYRLWKVATTDAEGQFVIEGAVDSAGGVHLERSQIAVTAAHRASRVFFWQETPRATSLKLEPAASIEGRVTDGASQPVAEVRVRVGNLPGIHEARTGADGRFEIADLAAMRQPDFGTQNVVVANHPDYETETASFSAVPSTVDIALSPKTRGAPASNADWPSFRGGARSSGVASSTLAANPSLLWIRRVENGVFEGTAVIAGDTAYFGSRNGILYALELESGQRRWEFKINGRFIGSPAVRDGLLYIGDEGGGFHCLDAETGARRWAFEAAAAIGASANVFEDKVLVVARDGTLYCLDALTGERVWKHALGDQLRSTPAIAEGRVLLAGCDARLHVLDLESGKPVAQLDIGAPSGATPAVVGHAAFLGTEGGQFYAIDWNTAEFLWKHPANDAHPIRSSAAASQDLVVVGTGKQVVALHPEKGMVRWTFSARSRVDSSPVIVGDRIYAVGSDGRLYGLDAASGEKVWEYEAGGRFKSSPAVARGRLIIVREDGAVYCFGEKK